MKAQSLFLSVLLVLSSIAAISTNQNDVSTNKLKTEQIKSDLIDAFVAFNELNGNKIEEKRLAESFGITTDTELAKESYSSLHQFIIARDAIIAVTNTANPNIEQLLGRGIKIESFENGNFETNIIVSNKVVNQLNSRFQTNIPLSEESEPLSESISILEQNKETIVICYFSDLKTYLQKNQEASFSIVPVDRNNNAVIDPQEDFYGTYESIEHALWVGKYPRLLISNILLTNQESQLSELSTSFVQWTLFNGQEILAENGYTNLKQHELLAQNQSLQITHEEAAANQADNGLFIVLIILGGIFILGFVVTLALKNQKGESDENIIEINEIFAPQNIASPDGLLYDKTHTWAFLEKSGIVTVGIDDFIRKAIGKADRIECMETGKQIKKGEILASLFFQGKKVQIKASISGTVYETNHDTFDILHSNDLSHSWICKIKPENWRRETDFMIMADQYRQWVRQEFFRLKDFLAENLTPNQKVMQQIILQDGGELKAGCLQELSPIVWEEFETMFL